MCGIATVVVASLPMVNVNADKSSVFNVNNDDKSTLSVAEI